MAQLLNDDFLDDVNGGVQIDGVEYYRVKSGDTLSEIAEKFHTTVAALCAANKITNPNLIRANQTIVVPPRK